MFCFAIVIGSNEMIGKECSFVYFSERLLEISIVRVPLISKRNWTRTGHPDLETVTGVISSSSPSEKSFSAFVSCSSAHVRTSATATSTIQSSINVTCHIPTFRSSLNGSFIAAEPYWLISRVKIVGIWNIIASCRRPVEKPLPCP